MKRSFSRERPSPQTCAMRGKNAGGSRNPWGKRNSSALPGGDLYSPAIFEGTVTTWTPEQSRELYNVSQWSAGYYDVDAHGHVVARPE